MGWGCVIGCQSPLSCYIGARSESFFEAEVRIAPLRFLLRANATHCQMKVHTLCLIGGDFVRVGHFEHLGFIQGLVLGY